MNLILCSRFSLLAAWIFICVVYSALIDAASIDSNVAMDPNSLGNPSPNPSIAGTRKKKCAKKRTGKAKKKLYTNPNAIGKKQVPPSNINIPNTFGPASVPTSMPLISTQQSPFYSPWSGNGGYIPSFMPAPSFVIPPYAAIPAPSMMFPMAAGTNGATSPWGPPPSGMNPMNGVPNPIMMPPQNSS
jgi:hypothetical protein